MKKTMRLFTERERETLQFLSMGLTYQKIAIKMDISHETVKMHIKHIYRKLEVQNKIEALHKVKLLWPIPRTGN